MGASVLDREGRVADRHPEEETSSGAQCREKEKRDAEGQAKALTNCGAARSAALRGDSRVGRDAGNLPWGGQLEGHTTMWPQRLFVRLEACRDVWSNCLNKQAATGTFPVKRPLKNICCSKTAWQTGGGRTVRTPNRQIGTFCSERNVVLSGLLGFSLRRFGKNDMFLSRTERTDMP